MAKRIYVGSLPESIDEAQLRELFAPYGPVDDIHVITDRRTGQTKGFAFVEMTNESDAQQAIQQLNGSEMSGRTLVVNESKERDITGRSGGGRRN